MKPENETPTTPAADQQISPEAAPAASTPAPITPPADDKIKTVTVDGYSFEFDGNKIDDVEVIEMAAQIEKGEAARIIDFMKLLIGEGEYDKMKNYFVAKDGRFKLTTLMAIFEKVFEDFDPKELV